MTLTALAEFLQTSTGFAMLGLIWVVQLVTYPAFLHVPADRFRACHRDHMNRISWIVVPLLLAELASALWLLVDPDATVGPVQPWVVGSLGVAWAATFFIQIPLHQKLKAGFDQTLLQRLVRTNWIRTLAWTAKAVLLAWQDLRLLL